MIPAPLALGPDEADLAFAADPGTALNALVLLVGGLALLPICGALVRRLSPRVPVFFARWRFSQLALVLLVAFLGVPAASQALSALLPGGPTVYLQMLGAGVGLGATCGVIAWVARRMDPDGLRSLGLWRGGQAHAAAVGALAYLLCAPTIYSLALLWPWVYSSLGGDARPQVFFEELQSSGGAALAGLVFLIVVVQPLFEELIFRSFMQPLFVQNLGDRGGVVLTSVLFAALHGLGFFMPIFALSLLLGALKLRTQRLAAPWAVHALHNGLMIALSLAGAQADEVGSAILGSSWLLR